MKQSRDELKLLSQELKNPYKQLNLVFLLISVIPFLSCVYILYGKVLLQQPLPSEFVPILLLSYVIMILGYFVGYRMIRNMLKKLLAYATRAKFSEEQRSSMAVALAHDLKSPLAVIKANMANLKAGFLGPLSPKQEQMADLCSDVTDRTAGLLMDLIKTYSPGQDAAGMQMNLFDLSEVLVEQLREVEAVAQTKNIDLKAELSKAPLPLAADRSMVVRAVNNLLNNAIKYAPQGGKVTLRAQRAENFAQVEVLNTGTPIPESQLEKIFESYERLDASVEGQGLGLGIARAIAEAHGGKVWAESAPGQPICFTALLPLDPGN